MTVYRQLHIYGLAIFDELVLAILLLEFDETLHGSLYLHKLAFISIGVSVASLGNADDPLRSNVSEPCSL